MPVKFSNNATSTLTGSINSGVTSLSVAAGQGALFPALSAGEWFPATLKDASGNMEVVHVTARSTDTFTIVRAQDGTTARSWASGDRIMLALTEAALGALLLEGMLSSGQVTNLGLAASVAANAMTIALKQKDGSTNCTRLKPAIIGFRDATLANGNFQQRSVEAALSLVIPSGATMGQSNATAANLYVYAIDNAGTVELAVAGYDAGESGRISTTVLDTASDSASVMYSTTARSNVAFRKLGVLTNTQATAGTWASTPSTQKLAPFDAAETELFKSLKAGDAAALRDILGGHGVIRQQIFTSSGTYTPHAKMLYAFAELVGGGGGGGSSQGSTNQGYAGGGGGGGGYTAHCLDRAGAVPSLTATIGSGGNGGAAGSNNGASGGNTSLGSIQANGGGGGNYGSAAQIGHGGTGGSASGGVGNLRLQGDDGGQGDYINSIAITNFAIRGGAGAESKFGGRSNGSLVNTAGSNNGNNGKNYGSGGGGGASINTTGNAAGGNGAAGLIVITEFCSS